MDAQFVELKLLSKCTRPPVVGLVRETCYVLIYDPPTESGTNRRIYFRARQIFAIFAYQSQSAKICTREIFVTSNPSLVGSGQSPCCCRTMALLHYFKPVNSHLPDPTGQLSADIPPPAICQANLDVLSAERRGASTKTRCRGPYSRLTNKQRVHMGKSVRLLPQCRRSCHAGYSSPVCTRDSPPLPHFTRSGIRYSL